jgi:hypothetical protein
MFKQVGGDENPVNFGLGYGYHAGGMDDTVDQCRMDWLLGSLGSRILPGVLSRSFHWFTVREAGTGCNSVGVYGLRGDGTISCLRETGQCLKYEAVKAPLPSILRLEQGRNQIRPPRASHHL